MASSFTGCDFKVEFKCFHTKSLNVNFFPCFIISWEDLTSSFMILIHYSFDCCIGRPFLTRWLNTVFSRVFLKQDWEVCVTKTPNTWLNYTGNVVDSLSKREFLNVYKHEDVVSLKGVCVVTVEFYSIVCQTEWRINFRPM